MAKHSENAAEEEVGTGPGTKAEPETGSGSETAAAPGDGATGDGAKGDGADGDGATGDGAIASGEDGGAAARSGFSVDELMPGLADAVAEEDRAQLAARIAELEAEREEMRDRLMRALAETENVRKRAERDRRDAETYGGTKLARDLLSVLDNLDRALKAADEALREHHAGFLEGVELTHRELLNAFSKHRIAPIEPQTGEKFDPNRHQAMFEAPIPGAPPGTVIEVMQTGFTIGDRLLRPAFVGIAKAPPQSAAEPAAEDAPAAEGKGADEAPAGDADAKGPGDTGQG